MPTYDYECNNCGYEFEAFHSMSAKPLIDCPECKQPELQKLIGMGAAAIVRNTETPCRGNRGGTAKKQRMAPVDKDKLGKGKNKGKTPFWRSDKVNKDILKDPENYINTGEVPNG